MDAGGELNAAVAEPIGAIQYAPSPGATFDDDCDDLYGDVNLSFLPLPPLSPSPSSPPKTPSPGISIPSPSPSPPPRRSPSPKPQPEPQQNPTPQHQPPLPLQKPPSPPQPKAPAFRHQPPRRASGRSTSSSSSPPTAALYIGDLPWWTTDAEVEAALAPHGTLDGLYFYADKCSGRSRGSCRADFFHPAAAASAAAALHGRVFDGHHCVASLTCPPELRRFGPDPDASAPAPAPAPAPNPTLGRGGNASSVTAARGKVGSLGDGSAVGPMTPRPRQFAPMIGGGGGFPSSVGHYNAGMGPDAMPPMVPPHVNPAYLAAASRMAMGGTGTGMWHSQGMAGGLWGGLQPWNFGGCDMSWQQQQQQPRLQQQHRQVQQYRNGNGGYAKVRGAGQGRPGGRNQDRDVGNVRGNPDRRQYGHGGGGGERPRERDRHREYVLERERGRERNCIEKDRHQQYIEHDDWERLGRTRSRSQSRDSDDDGDHPRRRR